MGYISSQDKRAVGIFMYCSDDAVVNAAIAGPAGAIVGNYGGVDL